MAKKTINIIGAGLCGSLISILMAKRGYDVVVREKRSDPRINSGPAGRSINLAMSAKGINALRYTEIFDEVEHLLMPMKGRMLHLQDGQTDLQPYGQFDHEFIYSVSRLKLNHLLIDEAEKLGVRIKFGHSVENFDDTGINFNSDGNSYILPAESVIIADGAGSRVRKSYDQQEPIMPSEDILPHSYKELTIPANDNGSFKVSERALHVRPRGQFMLIALPNPDGDFTLTLFMPTKGAISFDALRNNIEVEKFFEKFFPDTLDLIPNISEQFFQNPIGILGTVRCNHWHHNDQFILMGDAAHAMVPFHAQGMNSAFDDCVVFDSIISKGSSGWKEVFQEFEKKQKKNADAIQAMALDNYIEMRDGVLDSKFALKKELSFELERRIPSHFIPRYSMVMFHENIPYSVSYKRGEIQKEILNELTEKTSRISEIDLDYAENVVRKRLDPL